LPYSRIRKKQLYEGAELRSNEINEGRPFIEKSRNPTEQSIQAALGSTYAYYQRLVGMVSSYSQEWVFAKSSGWMLKVYQRKKALYYLIPLNEGFKVSLAIRETERDAFLRDDELELLRDRLTAAKKNPEGFAMQIDIANEAEFAPLELLIRKLVAVRS
jgi:Protein of unknown function (DUF3788)